MVSVIIPTLDAGSMLGQLLLSLSKQTIALEIIVVDSSSTDHTVNVAQDYGVKVLTVKKNDFNHGKTRNLGTSEAIGEVAVFITQDGLPNCNYFLENLLGPLVNDDIIAAYGRQVPQPGASPTETFTRLFNYPETPMIKGIDDLPRFGIKTFFLAMPARQ